MKTKTIIRSVLLLVVLGSIAVWSMKEFRKSQQIAAVADAPVKESVAVMEGKQVVMTYFRNSIRCSSCKRIEALSTETANKDLAKEIADGRVVFRVIDVDEPVNNHFIKDYQLTSKEVVLSYRVDGKEQRWESMEKIWDLLDEPEAFRAYVSQPVHQYLDL